MNRTDDPYMDFVKHDSEQEEVLKRLPECCECGEPIQQETAVYINDEWICDECLDGYRKDVIENW